MRTRFERHRTLGLALATLLLALVGVATFVASLRMTGGGLSLSFEDVWPWPALGFMVAFGAWIVSTALMRAPSDDSRAQRRRDRFD